MDYCDIITAAQCDMIAKYPEGLYVIISKIGFYRTEVQHNSVANTYFEFESANPPNNGSKIFLLIASRGKYGASAFNDFNNAVRIERSDNVQSC